MAKGGAMESMVRKFESIEGTIRAYTTHALKAFKNNAVGNVETVTLEFGVKIGGEAGIPYVAKGSAEKNRTLGEKRNFYRSARVNRLHYSYGASG